MEWIITAKLTGKKGFNVLDAFDEQQYIDWRKSKVSKNISEGDVVYIYVGRPYMKIMLKYRCINSTIQPLEAVKNPKYYNDPSKWDTAKEYFRLEKVSKSDDERLFLKNLNQLGLVKENIQGAYKSENNQELFKYIHECFEESISNEYDSLLDDLCKLDPKYKESMSKLRIGQGSFRKGLIDKYGCKCMLCSIELDEVLIASHIKEFSKSTKQESIDLNNGLLLCANHDKLFDRHLISFDRAGKLIISDKIKQSDYESLNIDEIMSINMNEKRELYMSHHREGIIK